MAGWYRGQDGARSVHGLRPCTQAAVDLADREVSRRHQRLRAQLLRRPRQPIDDPARRRAAPRATAYTLETSGSARSGASRPNTQCRTAAPPRTPPSSTSGDLVTRMGAAPAEVLLAVEAALAYYHRTTVRMDAPAMLDRWRRGQGRAHLLRHQQVTTCWSEVVACLPPSTVTPTVLVKRVGRLHLKLGRRQRAYYDADRQPDRGGPEGLHQGRGAFSAVREPVAANALVEHLVVHEGFPRTIRLPTERGHRARTGGRRKFRAKT